APRGRGGRVGWYLHPRVLDSAAALGRRPAAGTSHARSAVGRRSIPGGQPSAAAARGRAVVLDARRSGPGASLLRRGNGLRSRSAAALRYERGSTVASAPTARPRRRWILPHARSTCDLPAMLLLHGWRSSRVAARRGSGIDFCQRCRILAGDARRRAGVIRICACSVPRRCGRLVPRASCSATSLAWSVGTVLRQQDLAMRAVCPTFTSVLLVRVVYPLWC